MALLTTFAACGSVDNTRIVSGELSSNLTGTGVVAATRDDGMRFTSGISPTGRANGFGSATFGLELTTEAFYKLTLEDSDGSVIATVKFPASAGSKAKTSTFYLDDNSSDEVDLGSVRYKGSRTASTSSNPLEENDQDDDGIDDDHNDDDDDDHHDDHHGDHGGMS